jgi:hypothetical protein
MRRGFFGGGKIFFQICCLFVFFSLGESLVARGEENISKEFSINPSAEPELVIHVGHTKKVLKRTELLKHPQIRTLVVKQDVSYPGRTMTYQAIPVATLFEGMTFDQDAVIQFRCFDGFAAPISKERLLNQNPNRSIGYIAIETKEAPWPSVKPGGPSAGPFYLVWPDGDKSQILPEEWPFQLAAFEVKGSLKSLYPKIFPDHRLSSNHPIRRGMEVFVSNCFPCHTFNQEGAGRVGPDLNFPHSPVTYFKRPFLKKLIRNNQAVRHFPEGKMSHQLK